MRIAVISDTHNRLPLHLLHAIAEADEIWHLAWPPVIDLEREGFSIRLIHAPPLMPPPGCDLLLHGHTHIPRNERIGETRFFNPGTVGKPNKGVPPSYAWLELVRGRPPRWEIVRL
jgi:predicted phosphodiesterase